MAIETDLTISPYFVSEEEENYYHVLFKPSVPVQVRELNQLQRMLQNQIEKFGDNILKRGTIVRGCSFTFYENYQYIKIRDNETSGAKAILSRYDKMIVENAGGVRAFVQGFDDGYEANDPDLKTLYIRYNQSGTTGSTDKFSAGDILTVTNPNRSVYAIDINNGGTGYSNNDSFVFLSPLIIDDAEAVGFAAGHTIIQQTTNAQAKIVEVNTSIYATRTILKIAPLETDLATTNTAAWNFKSLPSGYDVRDTTTNKYATVLDIIGQNANAAVITDSTGRITSYLMRNVGTGYSVAPQVGVATSTGSGANVEAQNYLAKITIATVANSVGAGYAFGVSDGVIYQKGFFVDVDRQHVVVSKYDPTPNNLSVGFNTVEEIIDANEDTNLLDNALGTKNYTAPGADRLKLTPELIVVNTEDARSNTDFFAIVEFSEGLPYKQNQTTQYSKINDEISRRTAEQSGDFVLDRFDVASVPVADSTIDSTKFNLVIDPGTAYIEGYRVNTLGNYTQTRNKGIDLGSVVTNMTTALDYGSYVVVNNLLGAFPVTTGGTVGLYTLAKSAYSSPTIIESGNITAPGGTKIGEAKVRSIKLVEGYPGTASAKYFLYLFDIQMQTGKDFKDVRSIYDGVGSTKAVADIVTESIRSYANGTPIQDAVLRETLSTSGEPRSKLLFGTSVESPLSINSFSYNYLKSVTSTQIANTGTITITLTGSEYFTTTGTIPDSIARNFIIVPLDNMRANVTIAGTIDSNTSTANVIGSSTAFLSDLREGDYILFSANSIGGTSTRRVVNIVNNTFLQVDSAPSIANSSATLYRYFPKNVPLPFGKRSGMTLTVNSDARVLTGYVGTRLTGSANINLDATYPVRAVDTNVSQKTPLRNRFVKIRVANNGTGFKLTGYGTNKYVATTSGSNTATGSVLTYFAVGDSVVVENAIGVDWAAGNYQKPELTVVAANATHITFDQAMKFTSANVTIRKAGNLDGPWCLGVPDIFRLRAVYHSNSSSINTTSSNVTRHFYVDHNQTLNYYGLGYLYKRPTSNFIIRPGDYLLVKYDAFTSAGTFHHINSYVEANATLRFATDAKAFSSLTSTAMDVNTFEIPILKSGKKTYDLINHLDFRPFVAKTANTSVVSATDANITINPSDTVAFDTTDKKFPVPSTVSEYNAQGFLARVDSVYVTKQNEFVVKKGVPKPTSARAVPPPLDQTAMLLANMIIPAYPNVTEIVSNNTNQIINTDVVNETLLRDRLYAKQIRKQPVSQLTLDTYQPYRYTMADIGNLERRIKDLEYNVAFTLIELDIKDKKIPSNVDPSIDRFKFGFFTDTFDGYNLAEVQSQEFNAEILDSRVLPAFDSILIDGEPNLDDDDGCDPFLIVSQNIATAVSNSAITANVVTKSLISKQKNNNQRGDGTSNKFYTQNTDVVFASTLPATYNDSVKLYTYNYGALDRHEIYQAKSEAGPYRLIASSSDARQMTDAEASYAANNLPIEGAISPSLNILSTVEKFKKFSSNGTFTKFGSMITFSHNPANGRYYRVSTKKGINSGRWTWLLNYPINGSVDDDAKDPCTTPGPKDYVGILDVIEAKVVQVVGENWVVKDSGTTMNTNDLRTLRLKASGLKPNTKHKFYVQGKDMTLRCDTSVTPIPDEFDMSKVTYDEWLALVGAKKTEIMTNSEGKAEFLLYLVEDPSVFPGTAKMTGQSQEVTGKKQTPGVDGPHRDGWWARWTEIITVTKSYAKTGTYLFEIYNSDSTSYAKDDYKCTIIYQLKSTKDGKVLPWQGGGNGGNGPANGPRQR